MGESEKLNVVGVEILKKNGVNVEELIKQLVINSSVEFTAYYYFTLLRANCTGMEKTTRKLEICYFSLLY